MKISSLKSPIEFTKDIEALVQGKSVSYLEALMLYAELNNLELETIASLVKQNHVIKARLADESEELNLIQKSPKLPV